MLSQDQKNNNMACRKHTKLEPKGAKLVPVAKTR